MSKHVDFWTDAKVERLRRLLERGYRYEDIANDLGCTRNAAMGKSHRLGLIGPNSRDYPRQSTRPETIKRPRKNIKYAAELGGLTVKANHARKEAKKERVRREVIEALSTRVVQVSLTVEWVEETTATMACWECFEPSTMCHWPVRDDPHQFCGARRVWDIFTNKATSPYCARHEAMAKRPPKEKRA